LSFSPFINSTKSESSFFTQLSNIIANFSLSSGFPVMLLKEGVAPPPPVTLRVPLSIDNPAPN